MESAIAGLGDGHVESSEANDMVSTAAQATKFGQLIRGAFCNRNDTFIAVASCKAAGTGNAFLTALHNATGVITIASPGSTGSGGNFWSGAWWEADGGRVQVNRNGTVKSSSSESGKGIWRPF